jgi:hypothetical protein
VSLILVVVVGIVVVGGSRGTCRGSSVVERRGSVNSIAGKGSRGSSGCVRISGHVGEVVKMEYIPKLLSSGSGFH